MKKKEMTFWEHIYELRKRVIIVLISITVFSIVGYITFPYYFNFIYEVIKEELHVFNIQEGFTVRLKLSILIGIFLSIPVFIFQAVLFIFPALKKTEKIFFLSGIICSFTLFIFGVIFAYKSVLPVSILFLKSKSFFPNNVVPEFSYEKFVIFFFQFLIAFGLCFQFPIILLLLLKFGIIKMNILTKNFKYVVIVIFIIAAILTPPDWVSQVCMAIPMLVLYILTIIVGKIFKLGK